MTELKRMIGNGKGLEKDLRTGNSQKATLMIAGLGKTVLSYGMDRLILENGMTSTVMINMPMSVNDRKWSLLLLLDFELALK